MPLHLGRMRAYKWLSLAAGSRYASVYGSHTGIGSQLAAGRQQVCLYIRAASMPLSLSTCRRQLAYIYIYIYIHIYIYCRRQLAAGSRSASVYGSHTCLYASVYGSHTCLYASVYGSHTCLYVALSWRH
jgi:hypothetical protein